MVCIVPSVGEIFTIFINTLMWEVQWIHGVMKESVKFWTVFA